MKVCEKCVLPETFPGISYNEKGICSECETYSAKDEEMEEKNLRFNSEDEVKECLKKYKKLGGKYDVLVPLSGGVDSCFTLIRIVENFKLKPLVFHSDHGWDDPEATRNVEKLCKELDVDLLIWKNDLKFMRKLFKYFNESEEADLSACFVCGNMLYLNGLELADHFGIPLVINGYSKGQAAMMYDKEKSRELYGKMLEIIMETGDRDFLDKFNKKWERLEKQVIYQNKSDLQKDVDLEKILFIPFFIFKFYKTHKEELKKICQERFDWQPIKTSYPSRTTNCDMIWLNSFIDLKRRNYTHYHDEYSTMIRAGDFTREQALKDLQLNAPEGLLQRLADEIDLEIELDI
ncbi:MAG: phosphoadenosine phosphosulfate reductase family protein [bacterium]|nr:phosphoadenosine phosphosulfate reductase family protein [bacterium]